VLADFKSRVLGSKKISVWGLGYLGYTTLLTLQKNGFTATVYDFNQSRLDDLKIAAYPGVEQINGWTKEGKIPQLDLNYIEISKNRDALFDNNIHIISLPNIGGDKYTLLANYFVENSSRLKTSLVIFQSAGIPTDIDEYFHQVLLANDVDIDIATVFRSDWTIEEFYAKKNQRVVSASNNGALEKVNLFLSWLNLKTVPLRTIKEAEVYENARNALNYTVVGFFNQLSIAYPDIDLNSLSKQILTEINPGDMSLGVNSVDYKSEQSINNLLAAASGDYLSIIKEANSTNISFIFYYIDLLKSKEIDSVTILGISSFNNLKDLRFSPSLLLAEYLHKEGVKVYLHDDDLTTGELSVLMPYCEFIDINEKSIVSDVAIIMSFSRGYKFFTQETIDKIGLSKIRYVIDNTGYFSSYKYSCNTIYHHLCDGNLTNIVK